MTLSRPIAPVDFDLNEGIGTVAVHKFGDVSALVSTVGAEEYTGEIGEAHLKDVNWVALRAGIHERVIEKVMRSAPVFPVQFGTLFSTEENMRLTVERNIPVIRSFLEEVEEREEWGIKLYFDREKGTKKLLDAVTEEQSHKLTGLPPGVRYLREQQLKLGIAADVNRWLRSTCSLIADSLAGCAADHRERKLMPRQAMGKAGEIIHNWAFLVPRTSFKRFVENVSRINDEQSGDGLLLELTGPWPPYSFTPAVESVTQR